MKTQSNTEHRSFRFRTARGTALANEIAAIEALATERLRAGVSFQSVQTGALALLAVVMEGISAELVTLPREPESIPACAPDSKPPRCAARER